MKGFISAPFMAKRVSLNQRAKQLQQEKKSRNKSVADYI